jgi:membrane protease YdiL (CAAX protease family)
VLFLGPNTFDILLTSLLFASFHGGASYLIPISVPFTVSEHHFAGFGLWILDHENKSIWGAVIIHAAVDPFLFIAMLAIA